MTPVALRSRHWLCETPIPFHCNPSSTKAYIVHPVVHCDEIMSPTQITPFISMPRKLNANRKRSKLCIICELKATAAANINCICWIYFSSGHRTFKQTLPISCSHFCCHLNSPTSLDKGHLQSQRLIRLWLTIKT